MPFSPRGRWAVLPLLLSAMSAVADQALEETRVVDVRQGLLLDVANTVSITPDAATLLRRAPGANVNGNGPLTGIAQIRGMYGPRIRVGVNGAVISSGGPNWMDPPLSYAPAAQLESLEVFRGIAPVSAGQETIGGVINANTWFGNFSESDTLITEGRISTGWQSVNKASLVSAMASVANRSHRLKVSGLSEQADDAEFPKGDIVPSEYDRQRVDLGYGFTRGGHTLQLDMARSETGDTGTPSLPMDILYIDSDLSSVSYTLQQADWELDARLFASDIEHGMTNYHLRSAPANTSGWRRNIATGDNVGFKLASQFRGGRHQWQLGIDGMSEKHNSNIDNPNNPMFFVVNFNNAKREIVGVFLEREQVFSNQWHADFGLRYNRVEMDADEVNGTPAMMTMMGMSPGAMLRDTFNNAQRAQQDDNIDWVIKAFYEPGKATTYYAGLARKTRSPSYQERYLWLPLEATGGLADGRTYTGNLDLKPEVAHEIELGLDYLQNRLSLSPRLFYRDVDDYIQGTESSNMAAVQFVALMNMMNGTDNAAPLEFNNVEAILYGFDMNWRYQWNAHWSVGGLINLVRGERDDIDDNLYRIAPDNLSVDVTYQTADWSLTAESVLYDEQARVSETNSEQQTSGYGLLNLRGEWRFNSGIRIGGGVDNLLDKHHRDHLAGYNRVVSDDIAVGARMPGYGRNVYMRLDYQW